MNDETDSSLILTINIPADVCRKCPTNHSYQQMYGRHVKDCKMCGGDYHEHWVDMLLYCRRCRVECANFDMREWKVE